MFSKVFQIIEQSFERLNQRSEKTNQTLKKSEQTIENLDHTLEKNWAYHSKTFKSLVKFFVFKISIAINETLIEGLQKKKGPPHNIHIPVCPKEERKEI